MIVLTLIVILFTLALFYVKYSFSYWKRQGIPQDVGNRIPMGCLTDVAKLKKSPGMCVHDAYLRNNNPFVGIYILFRPVLMARDINLVRHIMVKSFNHFHDRGLYDGSKSDKLGSSLFTQTGQRWRSMRHTILPSFTAGKLKAMFHQSVDVADKMVAHMKSMLPNNGSKQIDVRKITDTYSLDIIGSTVFGLDINSFSNPKNEFKIIIEEALGYSVKNVILAALLFLSPRLFEFCKKIGFENMSIYSLRKVIKETIEHREKHNIVRKDILQLLMQLRSQGEINEDDNNWAIVKKSTKDLHENFNIDDITAECFIFLVAGQDTTAATSAFTIFELAQNPEILKQAQQEVIEVVAKNDGKITYESLQQMTYLELCMQETLRKFPGLPILNRICIEDFDIPGTDITIKKGTPIVIPLFGLHRDPEHFPDPDQYMPERFTDSARNYNPDAYMPFGDGPRICIAKRMGQMNSKLAVAKILHEFNIERMEKQEIEVSPQAVTLTPKGGIHITLSVRK